MKENNTEPASHSSPQDCAREGTVIFNEISEFVYQGDKIHINGECSVCDRKFERVWYYDHDTCYEPEWEEVYVLPQPH